MGVRDQRRHKELAALQYQNKQLTERARKADAEVECKTREIEVLAAQGPDPKAVQQNLRHDQEVKRLEERSENLAAVVTSKDRIIDELEVCSVHVCNTI